jgi:hypothetical protein
VRERQLEDDAESEAIASIVATKAAAEATKAAAEAAKGVAEEAKAAAEAARILAENAASAAALVADEAVQSANDAIAADVAVDEVADGELSREDEKSVTLFLDALKLEKTNVFFVWDDLQGKYAHYSGKKTSADAGKVLKAFCAAMQRRGSNLLVRQRYAVYSDAPTMQGQRQRIEYYIYKYHDGAALMLLFSKSLPPGTVFRGFQALETRFRAYCDEKDVLTSHISPKTLQQFTTDSFSKIKNPRTRLVEYTVL